MTAVGRASKVGLFRVLGWWTPSDSLTISSDRLAPTRFGSLIDFQPGFLPRSRKLSRILVQDFRARIKGDREGASTVTTSVNFAPSSH